MQAAGASIQIAGDSLLNSTERLVVVSGSVDAVVRAIFHISDVMLQVRSDFVKSSLISGAVYTDPVIYAQRLWVYLTIANSHVSPIRISSHRPTH